MAFKVPEDGYDYLSVLPQPSRQNVQLGSIPWETAQLSTEKPQKYILCLNVLTSTHVLLVRIGNKNFAIPSLCVIINVVMFQQICPYKSLTTFKTRSYNLELSKISSYFSSNLLMPNLRCKSLGFRYEYCTDNLYMRILTHCIIRVKLPSSVLHICWSKLIHIFHRRL